MLDINFIRENKEKVIDAAKQKGVDIDINRLLEVDQTRRELIKKVDDLRAQRNEAAKNRDIEKGRQIKSELDTWELELKEAQERFEHQMSFIPNVPLPAVPRGDESNNKVIKKAGEVPNFNFTVRDHLELAEMLDIVDIPRATKVSGSRFYYLKNEGVLLELALLQYALKKLMAEGFSPIFPPALIKQDITQGLGYWAGGNHNNYYLVQDFEEVEKGVENPNPLYLIGTAEHALVPMHKDEVFKEEALPKKYVGFSPSFRREAGTYGKDTRGILRVHQFNKVEMVAFVRVEDDQETRKHLLNLAESFMQDLRLPYQVVQLASGDTSFPAAETIDIETWLPGQDKYRETHSISTTTDFQARRLNIKYKDQSGQMKFVYILNGTAFAIGRTLIAILENYQQEDGSVKVPEVLIPYTGFDVIKPK
ncbi:MAG: Serine-tRNA ligase [Candidatus Daviesbacteria bacterium GW2011_GWA2_38_24]|uniref:Serine--tRNA ligase n=1 Tax=Candidatus Daviesbacteria bacterium GW2011_GWA2_38_24 TaxID=1618422 RepID=A0A0G0MQV2_9BACT|nr:MAG: Serine-tRNA ligase [Candidatus Daviesbacteria bacterium GW2011_GWA2_38_24]KKQ79758.1 MAG: Serine-tRNA ligase [Candidatus Daviesbacteria bacterium GW2011_GWA1_38_7]